MKVTDKDFNRLPQLDRIEFRQRMDYLEKERVDLEPFTFVFLGFFAIGFVIILSLLMWNINQDSAISLMGIIVPLIKVIIIFFVLSFIGNIIFSIKHIKKVKELEGEYFEVKKKK